MRPHLASLVADLRRHGPQTAVVACPGVRRHATTYAQLADLAGRFAAELDRRSIHPGDRVILWGENSAPWIAAFFGCLLRGVLAVPLDAAGSPAFAARVIADTSPRLLLADLAHLSALPSTVPALSLDSLTETLANIPPLFAVSPAVTLDAPFQIVFTSGTTGTPKGIVHTHRNVLASLDPIEREIARYRPYERPFHPLRFLHSLPLSHVFGQFMGLWVPPVLAAELHFDDRLEPARLLDRIRLNRISVLVAVPRTLELLRSHILGRFPDLDAQIAASSGLSIVKRLFRFRRIHRLTGFKFWALISGGATLAPELELFWGRLGFALIQGYGMTETAALVTLNHPFHVGRGTLGKPLPGREVRISPEGEILVRGDVVSTSTWADGRLQPRSSDWLATGDLATQDATGDLRFTGRLGDAIITSSGLNIHPSDLEAALLQHPLVRAAAVVPCPTPNGPEPVAVLLTNPFTGPSSGLTSILEAANRQLAPYQQLRRALLWPDPAFPFTSTGKLLRRSIAAWACQQLTATPAHPSSARTDPLLEAITTITHETPAQTDDTARLTEDLRLDSLGLVQLQSLLEQRFALDLSDDQIARAATLGDLRILLGIPTPSLAPDGAAEPSPDRPAFAIPSPTPPAAASIRRQQPAQHRQPAPTPAPSHRYPLWPWLAPVNLLRILFQECLLLPLTRLLAAPRVERATQQLPPPESTPPLLIIANHVTAYDVPLVLTALPPHLRHHLAIAMSGELLLDYRHARGAAVPLFNPLMPLAYWLLTVLFNIFPLPRLGGFRRSFEHAGRALDRGYSVLIFPEGRRSPDGTLQPFRSGIGLLAQQAEAAVLPVALLGLGDLPLGGLGGLNGLQRTQAQAPAPPRRPARWFRSGRLTLRVGNPIPYNPHATPDQTTRQLQTALATLATPTTSATVATRKPQH